MTQVFNVFSQAQLKALHLEIAPSTETVGKPSLNVVLDKWNIYRYKKLLDYKIAQN